MSYYIRDWRDVRATIVSEPAEKIENKTTVVREDIELLRASLEIELRAMDRNTTTGITSEELGNMSSKEIATKINNLEKILSNGME